MVLECAPVVLGNEIEAADRRLLQEARAMLPPIPFDPVDVFVVDVIGKDISGTGMVPDVIGMHRRLGGSLRYAIERIVVPDLSSASHGDAIGVGMADIVTECLRQKIDWQAPYMNAITSTFLAGAILPLVMPTVKEAVRLTLRPFDLEQVRMVHVRITTELTDLWIPASLIAEIGQSPNLKQMEELQEPQFERL